MPSHDSDITLCIGDRVEHEVFGTGVVVGWKNEGPGRGYTNRVRLDSDGSTHHIRTHRLEVLRDH